MNADEIVRALRICNRSKGHRCSECPVFSRYEHRICKATVDRDAADMIESLQAQLAERDKELKRLQKEVASLAIESIEREKTLLKLEAEVMVWAKAEREGRLVVLPCKCGECEKYKSVSPKCGNCNRTTVIQHPEDYCNHGIRRENNEN